MYDTGMIIGHFEPLHLGQMRSILAAAGQAKNLHIVITTHPTPHPDFDITLQDKARWLQMACAELPFIHIHTTDEIALPLHESFSDVTIDIAATNARLQRITEALSLPKEAVLFVADNHPLAQQSVSSQLLMEVITTPLQPEFDSYAIALDPVAHWSAIHAQAIREAAARATAPVTIIDTDFVTTQAFCEEYEGRTHPFVGACIDEFRLDHTIMLDNNTPWVADGMRSLGDIDARGRFEQRLLDIFARHDIAPHLIDKPDYDARYQQALTFINQHVYGKKSKT